MKFNVTESMETRKKTTTSHELVGFCPAGQPFTFYRGTKG
jgi:hypothetical protein